MNIKTIKLHPFLSFMLGTPLLLFSLLIYAPTSHAQQSEGWQTWVQQLRQDAIAQGISANVFDNAFVNMDGPNQQILHFDHTQPEKRISFIQYRSTRIDPLRIRMGRSAFQNNQSLLTKIGNDYGVDPCVVTAIWGIETSYGHYMGDYPVITSLATLAYGSDRQDYFRSELLIALHILNDGQVPYSKFKGEWAGASGYPQFMPSSWQKYAVDYNNNGRKDIWTSTPDGLASLANYLSQNGWQINQPWAIEVVLPDNFDSNLLGIGIVKTVSAWTNLGVTPSENFSLPQQTLSASIVQPNGGPAFMVFNNFNTLLKYNNSVYYACSVGYLADKICGRQ